MHTELKNNKKLKALYKRALDVKSAIPHPRIMGIIRECGGKMHMHERLWSDAATDFFEVGPCPATARLGRAVCGHEFALSIGKLLLSQKFKLHLT